MVILSIVELDVLSGGVVEGVCDDCCSDGSILEGVYEKVAGLICKVTIISLESKLSPNTLTLRTI